MQIYLDLHGVCLDFIGAAFQAHGRAYAEGDATEFNWWRAGWKMSDAEFWQPINAKSHHWWADLKPYPWLTDLIAAVGGVDPEFQMVSAPQRHGASAGGTWIAAEKVCGDISRVHLTQAKQHLSGPGRVLIDDSVDNCEAWCRAGGQAVLFPQPWNGMVPESRVVWTAVALKQLSRTLQPIMKHCGVPNPVEGRHAG